MDKNPRLQKITHYKNEGFPNRLYLLDCVVEKKRSRLQDLFDFGIPCPLAFMATDQLGTQWRLGRQNDYRLFVPDNLRSTPGCRDEKKFRLLCKSEFHECANIDPVTDRKITDWHFLNRRRCGCRLECLARQAIREVILLSGARVVFPLGLTLGVIPLLASAPGGSLPAFEIRPQVLQNNFDDLRLFHGKCVNDT